MVQSNQIKSNQIKCLVLFLTLYSTLIHSQTVNVTSSADSGSNTLRQAITDINTGGDASNTINLQIPGNTPISINSDLPVIKENTTINSTGKQTINGNGSNRLFATIMADLSLNNCTLQNGAAIGGDGGGGGMGAGGGVYIDRGNTLTLTTTTINQCKAQGGGGGKTRGGGGASFSTANKNSTGSDGAGDYPGLGNGTGGAYDGSPFLTGYGGGDGGEKKNFIGGKGGGTGSGGSGPGGQGGYCAGGGGNSGPSSLSSGNGGGNGGGSSGSNGGGGFGSGGSGVFSGGGGGFGGGGGKSASFPSNPGGGGGFGGGGGGWGSRNDNLSTPGKGGYYAGDGAFLIGGGGAGLGGAIFVGDTATCIIQDHVSISGNKVQGGTGANNGQGYAPDIFLFREARVQFNNTQPLQAPFAIQADQMAPAGHLDKGIVKQGSGQLTLSNPTNNYRGGTAIQGGTLSLSDPRALGSPSAPITLDGGTLQPMRTMTSSAPIIANSTGGIDTPNNTTLTTTGEISGTGSIDKTGTGKWDVHGTSTHSGDLNINQGTLQIDGTLPSNIAVNPNGTLAGNGTAGGNVTNNGNVTPGSNAIGTLTIGGDYTQAPSGTLNLELKPGGISDRLNVNGTANLDGILNVKLLPGIYPKDQPYTLINANPINGNFSGVSSNSSFPASVLITPNQFILTLESQIVYPIANDKLPTNSKNIANYLFCNSFPFENTTLVNLLQNLFELSIPAYIKALATLTPETYGALPLTQNQTIHYLATLPSPNCSIDKNNAITLTPIYHTSHYDKDKSLPDYRYNTLGLSMNAGQRYATHFSPQATLTYAYTYTDWQGRRGRATTSNIYLYPSLSYEKDKFFGKITLLGGYSYNTVNRTLRIGGPIHTYSNPHSWELAEAISGSYRRDMKYLTLVPQIALTQTNVFQSSIEENKPKGLNLRTESKAFCYLDTLLSITLQKRVIKSHVCIIPSLQLGWHNTVQLNKRDFVSKLDSYTACEESFITKTYCGNANRFFLEAVLSLSHKANCTLDFSYRGEFGENVLISGMAVEVTWGF